MGDTWNSTGTGVYTGDPTDDWKFDTCVIHIPLTDYDFELSGNIAQDVDDPSLWYSIADASLTKNDSVVSRAEVYDEVELNKNGTVRHFSWQGITFDLGPNNFRANANGGFRFGGGGGGFAMQITSVPEPCSLTLLALGAIGLIGLKSRRKSE